MLHRAQHRCARANARWWKMYGGRLGDMKLKTDAIGLTTLILVLVPWIGVAVSLLFRKKREEPAETKRAPAATWGIAMQSLCFPLVWSLPRPIGGRFRGLSRGRLCWQWGRWH